MKRWGVLLALVVSLGTCLLGVNRVQATIEPGWLNADTQPVVKLKATSVSAPKATYFGALCSDVRFKYHNVSGWGETSSGEKDECVVLSSFGHVDSTGIKLIGTDVSYGIRTKLGGAINLYGVPNSNSLITFYSAGGTGLTSYIYNYKNFPYNFAAEYNSVTKKPVYYKLTNNPNSILWPDGSRVRVVGESLGYSLSGRFLSANVGSVQTLIDLESNQARIFGQNTFPSDSTNPNVITSVNNSGNLVVVSDKKANTSTIYNLADCVKPVKKLDPEICQSRRLDTLLKSAIPNFESITKVVFYDDSRIDFYVLERTSSGKITNRYRVSLSGEEISNFRYLGLGDSYASGEGAYSYKSETDTQANTCHLSNNSYPYLITSALGYESSESVACSGAKIKDVFVKNGVIYKDDSPQSKGKDESSYDIEIFTDYLPGYRRQHKFVEQKKPQVITLSIGGNDIDFGKKLQYCILTQYSCYEESASRQGILKEINNQFDKLVQTYSGLKTANPDAKIYIIGYPYIVFPGGNCAVNVRLSEKELQLAEDIEHDLNATIKLAAKKSGVFFVDTSQAFAGRRLCEDKSWKLAVNGVTAGNDKPLFRIGPLGNETYHPNTLGHIMYKNIILKQTKNLTEPMPVADTTTVKTAFESKLMPPGTIEAKNIPDPILSDGIFGSIVTAGQNIQNVFESSGQYLKQGSTFRVELHSTPQVIGTATAIDTSQLSYRVTIPETIEPGVHSVHLYGTNIAGDPIDLYENIIIASSMSDYDGDGILNEDDRCNFITPAKTDDDKDSVDDACDPEITEFKNIENPKSNNIHVDQKTITISEYTNSSTTNDTQKVALTRGESGDVQSRYDQPSLTTLVSPLRNKQAHDTYEMPLAITYTHGTNKIMNLSLILSSFGAIATTLTLRIRRTV